MAPFARNGDRRCRKVLYKRQDHSHKLVRLHSARIASVTIKGAAVRSFQRTVAENLLRMRTFTLLFASIIAFGVVYNSARIALAERSRELAVQCP